jgi:small-conductance mechanosensitive channel
VVTATPSQTPVPKGAAESLSLPPLRVLVQAMLVLVLAYAAAKLLSRLMSTLADRLTTARFRVTLLIPVVKFVVYGAAIYVVVQSLFDLSTAQLVAFSGLLGAALGLGIKDLLADIIGGMVLVAEQPYRIGDKVAIGDHYGEVTDIGIRSTTLVTPNDTAVTVPNYLFFDESIANANAGAAEMMVVVEFFIATDADVATARRIVEDALLTSQYVLVSDDHPVTVLVEDDLHYRTIRGKAYVNDLRNEFPFKSDVTERTLAAFEEHDIESPRVHTGVDNGE